MSLLSSPFLNFPAPSQLIVFTVLFAVRLVVHESESQNPDWTAPFRTSKSAFATLSGARVGVSIDDKNHPAVTRFNRDIASETLDQTLDSSVFTAHQHALADLHSGKLDVSDVLGHFLGQHALVTRTKRFAHARTFSSSGIFCQCNNNVERKIETTCFKICRRGDSVACENTANILEGGCHATETHLCDCCS